MTSKSPGMGDVATGPNWRCGYSSLSLAATDAGVAAASVRNMVKGMVWGTGWPEGWAKAWPAMVMARVAQAKSPEMPSRVFLRDESDVL